MEKKIYGKEPHTATHKTYQTTDGYAFETFKEMMAHLDKIQNYWDEKVRSGI